MDDHQYNRRERDVQIAKVQANVQELKAHHSELAAKLEANTRMTEGIKTDTAGLVEAWTALSGGLKVLGWLGKLAKWLSLLAGAVSAVGGAWYMLRTGSTPIDIPK